METAMKVVKMAALLVSAFIYSSGAEASTTYNDLSKIEFKTIASIWTLRDAPYLSQTARAFFGSETGKYFGKPETANGKPTLLADQFDGVFDGAQEPETIMPDGNRLYIRSAAHAASDKGLLVTLGKTYTILAAAFIHHRCPMHVKSDKMTCDRNPTVTIFYSGNNQPNKKITEEIKAWVMQDIQKMNIELKNKPRHKVNTLMIEVRWINKPR